MLRIVSLYKILMILGGYRIGTLRASHAKQKKEKGFQKPAELNKPETLTKEKVRARVFGATRRERAREREREREARERGCVLGVIAEVVIE